MRLPGTAPAVFTRPVPGGRSSAGAAAGADAAEPDAAGAAVALVAAVAPVAADAADVAGAAEALAAGAGADAAAPASGDAGADADADAVAGVVVVATRAALSAGALGTATTARDFSQRRYPAPPAASATSSKATTARAEVPRFFGGTLSGARMDALRGAGVGAAGCAVPCAAGGCELEVGAAIATCGSPGGLIAPSGSVAGGDDPPPAGGGADPTAACGTTNARIFAVDGDSDGGAKAGNPGVTPAIGDVAVSIRCAGGRSVGFSARATSAAVGARMSPRSLMESVRFMAGNDEGIAFVPPSITSVDSRFTGADGSSGVGASGM